MVRRILVAVASRATGCPPRLGGPTKRGFTLVEMLIAMAITLVMMAAVTTLFANISNSVRNRRATIELTGQIRHLRNVLQQDLQGATCPGLTWQKSESNHGYIEIIEGVYRDSYPSLLTDGTDDLSATPPNPELDPAQSIIPRNNGAPNSINYPDANSDGRVDATEWEAWYQSPNSFKQVNGLGDYDDILMLTVRNEDEPFVGRIPDDIRDTGNTVKSFRDWTSQTLESTLAEVVWFAIENPDEATNDRTNRFFGEPGMRTIYRRTLLIAPWVNPYSEVANAAGIFSAAGGSFKAEPGLVRILDNSSKDNVAAALAALIAFQDRYDLSVRVEWDHNLRRWKIMANTLGDLTKRENRFGHFGFHYVTGTGTSSRLYPYPMISAGRGYSGSTANVSFVVDPEIGGTSNAEATANLATVDPAIDKIVASYTIDQTQQANNSANPYTVRPFAYVAAQSGMSATARAMLNDRGEVVRVVHGPAPLWGTRRGEDVMMTDALAFDLRVYDPGAPLFGFREDPNNMTILEPSDPGWTAAYINGPDNGIGSNIGANITSTATFPLVSQGAYVDMGYQYVLVPPPSPPIILNKPRFANTSAVTPWFFIPRALSDVRGNQLAPGYAVYDTWSFHYENNGRDDDGQFGVDQGINGLDDNGNYSDPATGIVTQTTDPVLGIDDVGERETAPPYDKPLRGAQVLVRAYERDSRAIRQVRVSQHFMPE